MLRSPSSILSASPEADATTKVHQRRNEEVVRSESSISVIIGGRSHAAVEATFVVVGSGNFPIKSVTVGVDGGPTHHRAIVEVVGKLFASSLTIVDVYKITPCDRCLIKFATVASIDATDTPLVDTRSSIRPIHINVRSVSHLRGKQHGIFRSVRTVVVAVGTIDAVVCKGTVTIGRHCGNTNIVCGVGSRNGKDVLRSFTLHTDGSLGRSQFGGQAHRSHILTLGTTGHISANHPSVVEAIASNIFPNSTIKADPTSVGVTRVGAARCHILAIVVHHHNPQRKRWVDGNRCVQRPFNEVLATGASVVLRVKQCARSSSATLVNHDVTSMSRIVVHAHLSHTVTCIAASGEHDTPVEGTA